MKKTLCLILIVLCLLSVYGCRQNRVSNATELDNIKMEYSLVCGAFATNLEELEERAQIIAIISPDDTYKTAKNDGKTLHRSCEVIDVIKGDIQKKENITVKESAALSGDTWFLSGGVPIMAKDFRYIAFLGQSKEDGSYYPNHGGIFCLDTSMNKKFRHRNQAIYSQVLKEYKQYFDGDEFQVTTDTEKEFSVWQLNLTPDSFSVDFEGESYTSFYDLYYPKEWFFSKQMLFRFSGKEASGLRVYYADNNSFGGQMIYVLKDGYLTPMKKDSASFENSQITSVRIFEKSNNDYCYLLPEKEGILLAAEIKNRNFPFENTNDMADDDAVLIEFGDSNGLYHRSVLYIEKGKLFGKSIGRELTDKILSFMTEENKSANIHYPDSYK